MVVLYKNILSYTVNKTIRNTAIPGKTLLPFIPELKVKKFVIPLTTLVNLSEAGKRK